MKGALFSSRLLDEWMRFQIDTPGFPPRHTKVNAHSLFPTDPIVVVLNKNRCSLMPHAREYCNSNHLPEVYRKLATPQ